MAPANSESRLGLTLQKYDQVIALSQANINQSLEYHFDTNPELCKFQARVGRDVIRGQLKPPTIELIDVENADQAFYCLEFSKGDYSFWRETQSDPNDDPDLPPSSSGWEQVKVPLTGWKLAFYVDFSLKKMAQVSETLQKQIQLPGSYSVEQLLINFGTAETMNFNWEKSVLKGFPNDSAGSRAKSMVRFFVDAWLTGIKDIGGGNHNVLGYAVKVDPAEVAKIQKTDPSVPPTAIRLQTIAYRPNGDASKISPANDYNAFLFTEMCRGNKMPDTDLQYSGDWFYDSIGGTLAMSRGIFWTDIKKKLRTINTATLTALNDIARFNATDVLAGRADFWLDEKNTIGTGDWTASSGLSDLFSWQGKKNVNFEREVDGPNPMYQYSTETNVNTSITPKTGTHTISVYYKVKYKSKWHLGMWGIAESLASAEMLIDCSVEHTLTIALAAVDETGGLGVTVTGGDPTPDVQVKFGAKGAVEREVSSKFDIPETERKLKSVLTVGIATATNQARTIQEALSGQGRFIFPGGGTFDMKSPIFNKAGDLLVGLSYRKGEAARMKHDASINGGKDEAARMKQQMDALINSDFEVPV